MNDDLSRINKALDISHITKKIVWENIIFVLTVKTLVLLGAALGINNMLFAIFADVGVCLLTIINTFRIFKNQK